MKYQQTDKNRQKTNYPKSEKKTNLNNPFKQNEKRKNK